MSGNRKNKEPEPLLWERLSDVEEARLTQSVKDELKELVQTGGKVEAVLKNLKGVPIEHDDTINMAVEAAWGGE